MSALSNAKAYLATLKDDGRTRYDGHPDVLLAELVAEIEAAPVVHVDGVVRFADGSTSVCTTPKLTDATLRPLMGKTVRLLALDSGGAGEVGGG